MLEDDVEVGSTAVPELVEEACVDEEEASLEVCDSELVVVAELLEALDDDALDDAPDVDVVL